MKKAHGRWWNRMEKRWIECPGYAVSFPGFEDFVFMVHKRSEMWTVTEQSSGCNCCALQDTRANAVTAADRNLGRSNPADLRMRIKAAVVEAGVTL